MAKQHNSLESVKHEIRLHQEINDTLFTAIGKRKLIGRGIFPLIHKKITCGEVN